MDRIIVCPHCGKAGVFQDMPEGYATTRWLGAREEVPYVRCPNCTATFPVWGIEEYLSQKGDNE